MLDINSTKYRISVIVLLLVLGSSAIAQQLPSGPHDSKTFGAFYTRLQYSADWDSLWRVSDHADVLVTFDLQPIRFVFWRGTSYIPCWVSENGIWYTNEFVERNASGGRSGIEGCAEPMSDKQCRFSHVRIIESSDVRVVVHWRYSPVDVFYRQPWVDTASGWGDWVDEYYYIYPDGVATRKVTLQSSGIDQWTEWFESIVINQPGTFPDDNIDIGALSIGNLEGVFRTYAADEQGLGDFTDQPSNPCILRINLRSDFQPFAVMAIDEPLFSAYKGHAPGYRFNFWNHWPVAQEKSWTTVAEDAKKPSHTSLAHARGWKDYSKSGNSITKVMLHGMTNQSQDHMVLIARSWMTPPEMIITTSTGITTEYDPPQRAYVVEGASAVRSLHCTVESSEQHPMVNPCILIRDWGASNEVGIEINNDKLWKGKDYKLGSVNHLSGNDLMIWLPMVRTEKFEIDISCHK